MKRIIALLAVLVLAITSAGCKPAGEITPAPPEPEPPSSVSAEPAPPEPGEPQRPELHSQLYPVGRIGTNGFIDPERATYDGAMVLEVPRMSFEGIVFDGTTDDVLKNGVGLFPEGQLPGPENRNVCIAGHRDIHGKEFWDIDKVTYGDLSYLTYQDKKYTYEYVETLITGPEDWIAIKVKEYSSLTLQSCTPIMVASHRIFAVSRLIAIEDLNTGEIQLEAPSSVVRLSLSAQASNNFGLWSSSLTDERRKDFGDAQEADFGVISMRVNSVTDIDSPERVKTVMESEKALKIGLKPENIAIVRADFNVEYDNTKVPYDSGDIEWDYVLIREDASSPWRIQGWGYGNGGI